MTKKKKKRKQSFRELFERWEAHIKGKKYTEKGE